MRLLVFINGALLFLLAAKEASSVGLLNSLQFTRDAFSGFSRGSERTVDILTPKSKPDTRPVVVAKGGSGPKVTNHSVDKGLEGRPHKGHKGRPGPRPTYEPVTRPNPTVITYERKRKTYKPRTSPSNKFLEAVNDIERAVANARAAGSLYNQAAVAKLTQLLEKAIRGKNYKYAREVLGQVLYLLNTKPASGAGREKRSSQNEGHSFLQGLRDRLGDVTFDNFMAVQGDVSLIFVIDDTGSMGEEIQATKNIAIDIINYPRDYPVTDYILSPFNDPVDSPLVHNDESEAGEFVQAINSLTPHSGGDCPEYAFRGMLEALARGPQWGSPMFVFTDAGPKDATDENMLEMKDFLDDYGVTINFFTTGYCRSQGFQDGDPQNLHPAFRELAELTGGQALLLKDQWELEKLNGLTGGGLDGTNIISSGSNLSNRKRRGISPFSRREHPFLSTRRRVKPAPKKTVVSAGPTQRYRIPVDDSIEKITVSVSTSRRDTKGQGIDLTDPDGAIITSGKVALSQICVYQITNPKEGDWTLVVSGGNGGHQFYVKSTSETGVDFEYYFIIPIRGRRGATAEVPISDPVIGMANKMVITVAGSEKVNSNTVRLELINKDGSRIRDVNLQSLDTIHYTASFTPPATPFKLKLKGTTKRGMAFERIARRTVVPTTAVLRGQYASNSYTLPLNAVTVIRFQLCNYGPTEYFQTSLVKDKLGYITSSPPNRLRVFKGRCVSIRLRARATRAADVDKIDTVFLIMKGQSSNVAVAKSMRLFVVRQQA